jgi:valyl-tRNA synthetase
MHLLEEYGADAVRHWAVSGRPGTDTAFDVQQIKNGRRLAVKLLNASKFALADLPPSGQMLTHPLDRAMIGRLAAAVRDATADLDDYDYARALERVETLFWWYCDFYLELVKGRRYDPSPELAASVSRALRLSLSVFQRLFAPFVPFVAAEVWSWWQTGPVHSAAWPNASDLLVELGAGPSAQPPAAGTVASDGKHDLPAELVEEDLALTVTAEVLREVRKAKTAARRPMRAAVKRALVTDTAERLSALELGSDDLIRAGSIERLDRAEGPELCVEVELDQEASA